MTFTHPRHSAVAAAGFALAFAVFATGCKPWQTTPPVCISGAKLGPGGRCSSQRAPVHRLPFQAGFETKVMQAYHGFRTHKKDLAYSVDYKCASGTPVVASRKGIVWAIREDSNTGCNDPSGVSDGNYVVIDHGDGTFSEYHHLQQFGALVEPGEQVCAGSVVGLCGTTGYSSGPHLHFALTDVTHRTVPTRMPASSGRYPFVVPEKTYVSENAPDGPCRSTDYSRMPTDAFAHHGIVLDETLPMVVERGATRSTIAGRYFGDHPQVAVHRKPTDGGEWIDECIPVDEEDHFAATLTWPKSEIDEGLYWFMVTGADEKCRAPGWAWSYKLRVD